MARALWKGQLRLSLVSIPVELHSATKSGARVSFRQIHKPTGKPIHYEKVVHGIGPVDSDDIVKGYEYEKDNYAIVEPEELEAVKLESKRTFELVQFVGYCDIPPLYFDKPYYLVPAEQLAEQAYQVVRDALRVSEKIGIGQITLRGREYLAAVKPCGDGLLLETLHYADEIKNADPFFSEITEDTADDELLAMATAIIDKKTQPFDVRRYHDHYRLALQQLIDEKLSKHQTRHVAEAEEPAAGRENVIDLVSALKKSLQDVEKPAKSKKTRKTKRPASGKSTKRKAS